MKKNGAFDRTATANSILERFYGIKRSRVELYRYLAENGAKTVREVSDRVGKDRSTAYRMLKDLCLAGLVYKESVNLPDGGYHHLYKAKPPGWVKDDVKNEIARRARDMITTIEENELNGEPFYGLTKAVFSGRSGTETAADKVRMAEREKKEEEGRDGREDDKEEDRGILEEGGEEEDEDEADEEEEDEEYPQIPIHLR